MGAVVADPQERTGADAVGHGLVLALADELGKVVECICQRWAWAGRDDDRLAASYAEHRKPGPQGGRVVYANDASGRASYGPS